MTNNSSNTPAPAPQGDQVPRYSASEQPVTRAYRIAFRVWLVCVLLTVVIALVLFLIDKTT